MAKNSTSTTASTKFGMERKNSAPSVGHAVAELVGPVRRVDPGRDGDDQAEDAGVQHQLQRHGHGLGDRRRDLLALDRRLAEVAAQGVAQPQHVAPPHRFVEVELLADLLDAGLGGARAEQDERQVALVATTVLQPEGERGDEDQGRDDHEEPPQDVGAVHHRGPEDHEGERHQQRPDERDSSEAADHEDQHRSHAGGDPWVADQCLHVLVTAFLPSSLGHSHFPSVAPHLVRAGGGRRPASPMPFVPSGSTLACTPWT